MVRFILSQSRLIGGGMKAGVKRTPEELPGDVLRPKALLHRAPRVHTYNLKVRVNQSVNRVF